MFKSLFLVVIVLLLFSSSCTERSDRENKTDTSEGESALTVENEQSRRTLTFGSDQPDDGAVKSDEGNGENTADTGEERVTPQLIDRNRSFIEHVGNEVHLPVDRVIGSLLSLPPDDEDGRQIYMVCERWLDCLKESLSHSSLEELYAAESRELILMKHALVGELQHDIKSARYGRIRFENGEARMDIRLFSDIGRVSGELLFISRDGRWLILSEDIDLSGLDNDYQFPDYSAEPELYGTFEM